jgi:hypothetical protein
MQDLINNILVNSLFFHKLIVIFHKIKIIQLNKSKIIKVMIIKINKHFRVVCISKIKKIERKLMNLMKLINNLKRNG